MGKFRKGKVHFYEQGLVPQDTAKPELSGIGGYVFDALYVTAFDEVATVTASQANTTVQARLVIPQRSVIVKVCVSLSAGAAIVAGDAFNIVKNTVAETASAGTAQTVQASGNSVFAADKAIGGLTLVSAAANVFVPDQPEAFYDTGDLLTLRLVTSAAAGTHFTFIKVGMLMATIDPKPYAPRVGDSGSLTGADPSADF